MIFPPFLDLTKKNLFGRDFPGRGSFFSANFLVGDIQTGIMPLLAVYLLLSQHWKAVAVGEVLAFGGLVTLIAQPIAGSMADQIVAKRTFFLVLVSLFAAGYFSFAVLTHLLDAFFFLRLLSVLPKQGLCQF
jgi:MFS family permease